MRRALHWFLFDTVVGDWLLALLERGLGLALVDVDEIASETWIAMATGVAASYRADALSRLRWLEGAGGGGGVDG